MGFPIFQPGFLYISSTSFFTYFSLLKISVFFILCYYEGESKRNKDKNT